MQVFGNIAQTPERKESRTNGRGYYQFRLAESQRGLDTAPTFYTVRLMKDEDPLLDKGDFVRVTGKLKADFYLSREGKPTGNLLVIAFEAQKIAKPAALIAEAKPTQPSVTKTSSTVVTRDDQVHVVEQVPTNTSGWYD